MEAMLYALATKFLDKTELRKVTEKINMALLGQLLMEDGIGKGEMIKLISLVMKKMKKGLFPEETAELPEKARIASAGFKGRITGINVYRGNPYQGLERG